MTFLGTTETQVHELSPITQFKQMTKSSDKYDKSFTKPGIKAEKKLIWLEDKEKEENAEKKKPKSKVLKKSAIKKSKEEEVME